MNQTFTSRQTLVGRLPWNGRNIEVLLVVETPPTNMRRRLECWACCSLLLKWNATSRCEFIESGNPKRTVVEPFTQECRNISSSPYLDVMVLFAVTTLLTLMLWSGCYKWWNATYIGKYLRRWLQQAQHPSLAPVLWEMFQHLAVSVIPRWSF